ncbi:MAG: family 16 glycosylhydrolase [Alphaproteobacteria bacterium]|nr:family 16 glycosylhydrolase [Alphaproteobacteria bacterium]
MNGRKRVKRLAEFAYRASLAFRSIFGKSRCGAFSIDNSSRQHSISHILIINLDREVTRWKQMQYELNRLKDKEDIPLTVMTARFSAVDAGAGETDNNEATLNSAYTLSEQLFVEPQPLLEAIDSNWRQSIEMSEQEQAIALSHVKVWDMIATSDHDYVLVLEDDVYFTARFVEVVEEVWADLIHRAAKGSAMDLLYLSFEEAKGGAKKEYLSEYLMRPIRGMWNLSGYVLSRNGAKMLLELLPVRGPVDLWINHQFENLNVFSSTSSLIEQRRDYDSSNSYSILPVLSKVGVLSDEGPAEFKRNRPSGPVFGIGVENSGLTSVAMALSMLGYRCCSDVEALPHIEEAALFAGRRERVFDAYVNVGSVSRRCVELAILYPESRIIIGSKSQGNAAASGKGRQEESVRAPMMGVDAQAEESSVARLARELERLSVKHFVMPADKLDGWTALCEFLECQPPVGAFPWIADRARRLTGMRNDWGRRDGAKLTRLKFDSSPWVIDRFGEWQGIPTENTPACCTGTKQCNKNVLMEEKYLDSEHWMCREDTFPSNLVLFRPRNFCIEDGDCGVLTLRREKAYVRNYTSASISSRESFLYGKFEAEIKPAPVSGVITGMFLHRSSPRQEIDVEFLGRDCRKILTNVYYNPGIDGSRLDYGYRGTPILIELGFDASESYHLYSIEWYEDYIRWFVDGRLVHERVNWEPTPIPHLPMHFHINLWASRSRKLTGVVRESQLPTQSRVRRVGWCSWSSGRRECGHFPETSTP